MQINSLNNTTPRQPAFQAKIGSGLKFLLRDNPKLQPFMEDFSKWGDPNSVVDIYSSTSGGKTRYMLRLKNEVLDETHVPAGKAKPVWMKKDLAKSFFDLTSRDIDWAEYKLFKNVKDYARSGKPCAERLSNIIKSHKQEGKVLSADAQKRFDAI